MKILMLWIFLSGFIFSLSAQLDVVVTGISDNQRDGAQKDRQEAIMDAKRQACEKAGVRLKAQTTVENFQTVFDYVESQAETVLLPGFQIVDNGYREDGTYTVVLIGKVKVIEQKQGGVNLVAEAVALRNQALKLKEKEKIEYWSHVIKKEEREDVLQKSLLLALEAFKQNPGQEEETAIRQTLAYFNKPLAVLEHDDHITDMEMSPDGKLIATAGKDNYVLIWDAEKFEQVLEISHDKAVVDVAFSPDSKLLLTAGNDMIVKLIDITTGEILTSIDHIDELFRVQFSPDGRLFVTVCRKDAFMRVFETVTLKEIYNISHNNENLRGFAFGPESKKIATYCGDEFYSLSVSNTATIWNTGDGTEIALVSHKRSIEPGVEIRSSTTGVNKKIAAVKDVAFSPDGTLMATAGADGFIIFWDSNSGEEKFKLRHKGQVEDIDFSPDGKSIVSACSDSRLHLWDLQTKKEKAEMKFEDRLIAAAFSPDGKYVAAGSMDRTARVFDVEKITEVFRLVHGDNAKKLIFSPDSKYLLTLAGSWDGKARVWNINPENLEEEVCRVVERNLTPEEWQKYMGDEPYRKTCGQLP